MAARATEANAPLVRPGIPSSGIDRFLRECLKKGTAAFFDLVAPAFPDQLVVRVLRRLDGSQVVFHTLKGSSIRGIGYLEELKWDSSLLGMKVGRIGVVTPGRCMETLSAHCALHTSLTGWARRRGFSFLVSRVSDTDSAAIVSLTSVGALLVDHLALFALDGQVGHRPHFPFVTREWRQGDLPALRRITRWSYAHSRFSHDPHLGPGVNHNVYSRWLTESIEGRAQAILVASGKGGPVGYVTCLIRDGRGVIELLAVSPRARGLGLGSLLVVEAVEWFRRQGVAQVVVGTQMANRNAVRLYQGLGFRLAASFLTFHKWLAVPVGPGAKGEGVTAIRPYSSPSRR